MNCATFLRCKNNLQKNTILLYIIHLDLHWQIATLLYIKLLHCYIITFLHLFQTPMKNLRNVLRIIYPAVMSAFQCKVEFV